MLKHDKVAFLRLIRPDTVKATLSPRVAYSISDTPEDGSKEEGLIKEESLSTKSNDKDMYAGF